MAAELTRDGHVCWRARVPAYTFQAPMGIILVVAIVFSFLMLVFEGGIRATFAENHGNINALPAQNPYGNAETGDRKSAIFTYLFGFALPHAVLVGAFLGARRRQEGSFRYLRSDEISCVQGCCALLLVGCASIVLVVLLGKTIIWDDYLDKDIDQQIGAVYQKLDCEKLLRAQVADDCVYASIILFVGEIAGLLSMKGSGYFEADKRTEIPGELHTKLGLSGKVYLALDRAGITTIEELLTYTPSKLMSLPGIGEKSLREIETSLERMERKLPADE